MGEKREELLTPWIMESARTWGSLKGPVVDLASVCVVGPVAVGLLGVMAVVGWAISVLLVGTGGECMSLMASHTAQLLLGLMDGAGRSASSMS